VFNILVDCVIRHWLSLVIDDARVIVDGMGLTVKDRLGLSYADDCILSSTNRVWLQIMALDVLLSLFRRLGLQCNAAKTKTMT
jgi:hypothetical protein